MNKVMEPQSPSKSKFGLLKSHKISKICLIFVGILLGFAGILYGFGVIRRDNSYFTVVVDCGSTGTRVNVYQWSKNGGGNGNLPILLHSYPDELMKSRGWRNSCQYHCMQTEPGLDKFVGNYSLVRASVEPLIHWAEGVIPSNRHWDTPIFVLATAGLRRISVRDAELVLSDVVHVVKEHSFKWKREWIRVLSGVEEAYYGWVALNYKMGNLRNESGLPTLGLLDLGGSSLQVVMETDNLSEDRHLLLSKIGVVEHRLVAYSLPAFGLNEAFHRTVYQLKLLEKDVGSQVSHPCLSSRFVGNYSCSSCFRSGSLVHLVGNPNWVKCKMLARAAAMNSSISGWSEPKFLSSCKRNNAGNQGNNALKLAIGTNPGVRYHALSGFFAVYNLLNLTPEANLSKIWEKAQHLCSSTWADSSNVGSSVYCFKVLYLASLIEDGLCLGNADIVFGPGDISWTLGASVVAGEHTWRTSYESRTLLKTPEYMEVISSPIFIFIILAVLLFVVYHSQIKLPVLGKRSGDIGISLASYSYPRHRPH